MQTVGNVEHPQRTRAGWPPYRTMWFWLLLGWTVSAADRAMTGPVVTWMIGNHVGFLADASKPYALGGLVGGLFFAGYMLTQWPGGYLGDRYGHRTLISVSLIWAGIATLLSGLLTGLVVFIAIRVLTGLGEGAFYSNDRSLIAAAVLLLLCVREGAVSRVLNRTPAPDAESRLGPRMQPSRRTVV